MDSMDVSKSDNNDTGAKNKAPQTNSSIEESYYNCYFNSRYNDNYRAINKISEESKTKD